MTVAQPEAERGSPARSGGRWSTLASFRFYGAWVASVLLFLFGGLASPGLFKATEITAILQVASFTGLAALGETVVMLTAGIDLSMAGTITIANIAVAVITNGQANRLAAGIVIALVLTAAAGAVNGLLVTRLRISPLIATLATGTIYTGAALLYTGGSPEGAIPAPLADVGQGRVGVLPYDALIWLVIGVAVAFILRRTTWGRALHAVGASPMAALISGVPTRAVTFSAYVLSGLLGGCTGILLAAYVATPSLTVGADYLLAPIAAAVVGGTLLTGGIGSSLGTAGGALFVTNATVIATTLHVSSNFSFVIEGVIIVASVALTARSTISVLSRELGQNPTAAVWPVPAARR